MKFKEKPRVVEAQQFFSSVKPHPEGVNEPGMCLFNKCSMMDKFHVHRIGMYATVVHEEDFVVKTFDGDLNVYGPKLFLKFYERDFSE